MKTNLELAEEAGFPVEVLGAANRAKLDRFATLLLADRMPSRERLIYGQNFNTPLALVRNR